MAITPVPKTNDRKAWRSAVMRIAFDLMFVSDTWYVMPIVNAT